MATIAWVGLYWPGSIAALRNSHLITDDGETIKIETTGRVVIKTDILSVEPEFLFFTSQVVIKLADGSVIKQIANFIEEDVSDTAKQLRESVFDADKAR